MLGLCGLSLSWPYRLRWPVNYVAFCLWLFIRKKVFNSQYYCIELFILASFNSLQSFRLRRFVVFNFLRFLAGRQHRAKYSYYTVCVWLFSHGKSLVLKITFWNDSFWVVLQLYKILGLSGLSFPRFWLRALRARLSINRTSRTQYE